MERAGGVVVRGIAGAVAIRGRAQRLWRGAKAHQAVHLARHRLARALWVVFAAKAAIRGSHVARILHYGRSILHGYARYQCIVILRSSCQTNDNCERKARHSF